MPTSSPPVWRCLATASWRPKSLISSSAARMKNCSATDSLRKDKQVSRLIDQPLSPLEQFVRDYAEARGGVWDQIEPRVYDLLIGSEITPVAFYPEALPEQPQTGPLGLGMLRQTFAAGGRARDFSSITTF